MKIVIVDYGMGNLQSVYNAFNLFSAGVKVSDKPQDILKADKLVLPGVGAFGDAMKELRRRKLAEPINEFIAKGKPYLGLCLGLQLLFEKSDEARTKGLGILKGSVKKFKRVKGCKIPHMGWNTVNLRRNNPIMIGIKTGSYFYFVHSYYCEAEDKKIEAGWTEYAKTNFTSFVSKENIYATQFHPEKSQEQGLRIVENFVKWI